MRNSRYALLLSVFSASVLFTACSGGGGGSPTGVSEDLTSYNPETGAAAVPASEPQVASAEPAKDMSPVDSVVTAEAPAPAPEAPVVASVPAPVVTTPSVPSAGGSGYLLSTDLESEDLSCWNDNRNGHSKNSAGCGVFKSIGFQPFQLAEGGITHSGRKAIDITYVKNEEAGGTDVGLSAETVNMRAYYYFEPGFDFGQGMKIGRVSSFNSSKQKNDIDIILEIRSGQGGNQCGVTDSRDVGLFFNGAPKGSDWGSVAAPFNFQRGRWYAIEYQVVLNTPGRSDGSIKLWIDGAQVASRDNLSIRGSLDSKLNSAKIGGWYSNGAHGNSCANPAQPSKMHMDDIAISKSYIGT